MSETSKIEWTDSTFNPWKICTPVGPGCKNCYAAALSKRYGWGDYAQGVPRQRTSAANWKKPLQWNARDFYECKTCGWRGDTKELDNSSSHGCPRCITGGDLKLARRRVFCASLADVFDNEAPIAWFVDLMALVRSTPNLDWLLLTKRVGNFWNRLQGAINWINGSGGDKSLAKWLQLWLDGSPPENVWVGATVVNQPEADRDVSKLLMVPARVRFLSIEPMLGPINLRCIFRGGSPGPDDPEDHGERMLLFLDALSGKRTNGTSTVGIGPKVDWVICGGESGPGARPIDPNWARLLRDQCVSAGVAFHFKQWGEWAPHLGDPDERTRLIRNIPLHEFPDAQVVNRIGKKAAGRLLDGRTWDQFPTGGDRT